MAVVISLKVRQKLAFKVPPVSESEIRECFENRDYDPIEDSREDHRTRPPTMWFIAETNQFRRLKIVFIQAKSGDLIIKTAYEPDDIEELIYEQKQQTDHDHDLDDVELWDTKQLGADPEYARRVSPDKAQEVDDSLGLQAISIRLQRELVEQIKELAHQDGIGYQPYIRQLLTRHVRESAELAKHKKARA